MGSPRKMPQALKPFEPPRPRPAFVREGGIGLTSFLKIGPGSFIPAFKRAETLAMLSLSTLITKKRQK